MNGARLAPEDHARARLAAIVRSSADAIVGETLDGIVTDWNPAAERLYGYRADEVIGRHLSMVVPPDRLAEAEAILTRARRGESVEGVETVRRTKDGRLIDVALTVSPVWDDSGALIATSAIVRDITERRRLERELLASEARYRALVEQVPAVVYEQANDARQTSTYFGPQFSALTGYSMDEIMDQPPDEHWHDFVHPDDRERVAADEARSVAAGEPFHSEYRLRRKDGSYVWVRDACVPVHDDAGAVVAWQGVLLDITERVVAEQALAASLEAAEMAVRTKSQFLAMMSHELRTPLQAVLGYADFLLNDSSSTLTAEQREDIGYIFQGAERMVALIGQLLDLSRLEAGRLDLAREPLDLRQIIEQVRQDVAPQAATKGLTLTIRIPSRLPRLLGDAERVRQILLNLVGNAVKFTECGGITIRVAARPDGVAVAVADSGIGIAPEALPTIFEEFRQLDTSLTRRHGGAGLGLAIARKLAEQMGGQLTVESTPGVGSTFTLWLPATVS